MKIIFSKIVLIIFFILLIIAFFWFFILSEIVRSYCHKNSFIKKTIYNQQIQKAEKSSYFNDKKYIDCGLKYGIKLK
jgi:uncharacterized protein YxeA